MSPLCYGYVSGTAGQLIAFILFCRSKIAHAVKSGIGKGKIGCTCEGGILHDFNSSPWMVGFIINPTEGKGNKKFQMTIDFTLGA